MLDENIVMTDDEIEFLRKIGAGDEFDCRPEEVERHEKVITITEWLPIKR